MKNTFLAALSVCLILASCSKSSSDSGNSDPTVYIKFAANGTQKNYTMGTKASTSKDNNTGIYMLSIGTVPNPNPNNEQYGIVLNSATSITAGMTFTADFVPGHTDLYGISQADVGYSDGTGNHYVNCPPTLAASFAPETVTITELDASHVKGTFSASLIDARTLTVKVTITNGEFYSKF